MLVVVIPMGTDTDGTDHGVVPRHLLLLLLTPMAVIMSLPLVLAAIISLPLVLVLTPAAVATFSNLLPSPFAWLACEGGQSLAANSFVGIHDNIVNVVCCAETSPWHPQQWVDGHRDVGPRDAPLV